MKEQPMYENDQFQHLREQHNRAVQAWFAREPQCHVMYERACAAIGKKHSSFTCGDLGVDDVFWSGHVVRHALGVSDPYQWLWLTADLERHGWASVCSYGGADDESWDRQPLEEWGERSISLCGVNWLIDRLGARRAITWTSGRICAETYDSA
jgi:hypothetical protein